MEEKYTTTEYAFLREF